MADNSSSNNTINIEIVSDNVCPWCYVGKRNLEKAIASSPQYKFNVSWKPFQLRPDTPKEGTPFSELVKRYPNFEQMQVHLNKMGKEAGIDFVERTVIPNTLDSHRLVYYARKQTGDDNVMIAKLFHAYFEQGKNIGDHQVLAEIAQSAGLDPSAVKTYLDSNEDVDAVKQEVYEAQVKNIRGVPHFTLSKPGSTKKQAISGGQPPQTFAEVFAKF